MTATDTDLLTAFSRHRDEASFRELTQRHFSLIFNTALRSTGSRQLAEEITQNVLCAVARKAATLARKPGSFPAWLHRATLFESTTAMRKEAVRQRHLNEFQQAAEKLPAGVGDDESLRWQQALPHLDLALDKLTETDRRVLLLHFFEQMPFPVIATQLGKSSAAVQKQSVRALEKLSLLLRSRKAAVSVTLLATGLSAESAKAAPLALIPAFTAHAISSATGLSGLSAILATHQKILVPCALVILGVPLGIQQAVIVSTGHKIEQLQSSATAAAEPRTRVSATGEPGSPAALDFQQLAQEALMAAQSPPLSFALDRKLSGSDVHRLADLLRESPAAQVSGPQREAIMEVLVTVLGKKDPALALRAVAEAGGIHYSAVFPIFALWLRSDLPSARDWLLEQQRLPEYASELALTPQDGQSRPYEIRAIFYHGPDGEALPSWNVPRTQPLLPLQASLLSELLATDPGAADAFLDSLTPGTWQLDILQTALAQERRPFTDASAAAAFALLRKLTPIGDRDGYFAYLGIAALWREGGRLGNVEPLLHVESLDEKERVIIAQAAAKQYLSGRGYPGNPSVAMDAHAWLQRVIPAQSERSWELTVTSVEAEQNTATESALSRLKTFQINDQNTISTLRGMVIRTESQARSALELCEKITDPVKRESTIKYLHESTQR